MLPQVLACHVTVTSATQNTAKTHMYRYTPTVQPPMGAVSAATTPATIKDTTNSLASAIAPRHTHGVAVQIRDSVQTDKLVERSETIQHRFQQLLQLLVAPHIVIRPELCVVVTLCLH